MDCSMKKRAPGEFPMFLMRHFKEAQRPRNAYCFSTKTCHMFFNRISRLIKKIGLCGACRGHFSPIVHNDLFVSLIVIEHESSPSDSGGLRLYYIQNHLHGNSCIDCSASFSESGKSCFRRMGIC